MAKKILVTAFEPFGGRGENPTLALLAALKAPPGTRLAKARLPVSGRAVGKKIQGLINRIKPDLVISLGLAAGETAVRVERFALNIADYCIKDNAGWQPEGKRIDAGGPAAYFVTADPLKIAGAICRAGLCQQPRRRLCLQHPDVLGAPGHRNCRPGGEIRLYPHPGQYRDGPEGKALQGYLTLPPAQPAGTGSAGRSG